MGFNTAMALGGLGVEAAKIGAKTIDWAEKSSERERAEQATLKRDQFISSLQEGRDIATENRKLEVRRGAAKSALGLIESARQPTTPNDDEGNAMPKVAVSPGQEARMHAQAYESAGLTEEAHRYRQDARGMEQDVIANRREDLRDKRDTERHAEMIRRLDLQEAKDKELFKHMTSSDATAASNASRMLLIAEEQVKGLKLDNEKKQEYVNLEKKYTAATDPKEREKLAEQMMVVSGKWNENFEVKVGKDEQGRDTVLGYIDKRRGTFTDNNGKITDMRTGQSAGGAAPSADDIALAKKVGARGQAAFEGKFGVGSWAKHVGGPGPAPANPENPDETTPTRGRKSPGLAEELIEIGKKEKLERESKARTKVANTETQIEFASDQKTMTPSDLYKKYISREAALTRRQATELREIRGRNRDVDG